MTATRALVPQPQSQISAGVIPSRARHFVDAARAENTVRAYRAAWEDFCAYCAQTGARSRPADPATVADYLTTLAEGGLKVSTLAVRLSAISQAHRLGGHPDPTRHEAVKMLMSGIRRKLGSAPAQKAPVLRDDIRRMVAVQPDMLAGLRNRALLLVGFAGAFRRSELTGLDVSDLRFTDEGVVITLRRSKTDQEGRGIVKHIPTLKSRALCPVTALRRWLEEADIHQGPIFRAVDRWGHVRKRRLTAQVVAAVVKQAAVAAGLDPRQYAGHSLRAGFVTQASLDDEDVLSIQEVTGHTDMNTIVKYQRSAGRKARETVRRAMGE